MQPQAVPWEGGTDTALQLFSSWRGGLLVAGAEDRSLCSFTGKARQVLSCTFGS